MFIFMILRSIIILSIVNVKYLLLYTMYLIVKVNLLIKFNVEDVCEDYQYN
jgi:hypothetical protein